MNNLAKELRGLYQSLPPTCNSDAAWEAIAKRAVSYLSGYADVEDVVAKGPPKPDFVPNFSNPKPPKPLTKLEQFTMAAMQGVIASPDIVELFMEESSITTKEQAFGVLAMASVTLAQATIAQLEEKT